MTTKQFIQSVFVGTLVFMLLLCVAAVMQARQTGNYFGSVIGVFPYLVALAPAFLRRRESDRVFLCHVLVVFATLIVFWVSNGATFRSFSLTFNVVMITMNSWEKFPGIWRSLFTRAPQGEINSASIGQDESRTSQLAKPVDCREIWKLFSYCLPRETRERVFEPEYEDMCWRYIEAYKSHSGKWERRWLTVCFTVRTIWMVCQCFYAMGADTVCELASKVFLRR
ncbi:MAG: hypothetical protein H6824_18805 [Planctomycetaceae bacterium]|nr:hypothetical protein [Planctomycetaceae bacterium]